jgi:hypothetical protein
VNPFCVAIAHHLDWIGVGDADQLAGEIVSEDGGGGDSGQEVVARCGRVRRSSITGTAATELARKRPGSFAPAAISGSTIRPFKACVRSAFEKYQLALRRVLQARQSAQMDMRQSAAS